MSYRIFSRTLRVWRTRLVVFGIALLAFEWLIVAVYPSFGKFFVDLPEALKVFLRVGAGIDFGASQFLSLGYFHPIFLIVSSAFVIALAVSAVSGEIEKGTINLLLARPVPRSQLLVSRGVLMVLGVVGLMLAGVAGTAIGVATVNMTEHVDLARFLLVAVNGMALFLAVGGYSFLFSAMFNDGGRAVFFSAGLTLIFYLINYLAGLWQTLKDAGPFSLFHYYDPGAVVQHGLSWHNMIVLLVVAGACFVAALIVLQRRDIAA